MFIDSSRRERERERDDDNGSVARSKGTFEKFLREQLADTQGYVTPRGFRVPSSASISTLLAVSLFLEDAFSST